MSSGQKSSPTPSDKHTHRIFLLTVWQEDDENWRFLVEDPRTGKREGFPDIESLTDGLPALIGRDISTTPSQSDCV